MKDYSLKINGQNYTVQIDEVNDASTVAHIPEMIQQAEDLLARHRIGILALDALDLGCDTLVHLSG